MAEDKTTTATLPGTDMLATVRFCETEAGDWIHSREIYS